MNSAATSVKIANIETGPIAWTGNSLGKEDGIFSIPENCLKELDVAARLIAENPLPIVALKPDFFDLESCVAFMGMVRETLENGVGFAILDRLPVAQYSTETSASLYWLLTSLIAKPVAQKWDGKMMYDVADSGQKPGNGVRPDITNVEQNFHTDNSYNLCPPDYVTLFCVQTAKEGGISRIISFPSVHNEFKRKYPDLLPRLYRPYIFDRQREHAPDSAVTISHPIFESADGAVLGRLSRFQVRNGYKLANETMDAEGAEALDALEEIMDDPTMWKDFYFEPGQIQIVDNRRCGHKRTAFVDYAEPERKRRLIRLWLRASGRPFYNG
ncbi:MAG: TauD/TfdA family dioxygenase [Alphaproteobacteria bacterium]|nr:TauD/TfdA family dioxygenase [Alphaproteobacteria bacterium]